MINKKYHQLKEAILNNNRTITGHLLALFTVTIWGTTFISTKILLTDFSPVEILFFRFTMAFIALSIIYPHRLKLANKKQELYFAGAGLCGVTLYFLLENIALTYTLVSNVGVILSVAPFFTAILALLFLNTEKLRIQFFIGFVTAIVGIFLISFNGSTTVKFDAIGDILAVLAAVVWAIYSILMKKISIFHYNTVQTTRRIFGYGLLFMIPALFIFHFNLNLSRFESPTNLFNILYLGLGASAICFVTWNLAIKILGAVKTSTYIYIAPVITIITAAIILSERITFPGIIGTVLTLAGLIISESKIDLSIKEILKKRDIAD